MAASQVAATVERLTDAEWGRLEKAAATLLWGTRFHDPRALINETMERFLAGSRSWPSDVPFETCFVNAMRSVANGVREQLTQQLEVPATELVSTSGTDCEAGYDTPLEQAVSDSPSPEALLLTEESRACAERDLAVIEAHFRQDEQVTWILMGIEYEMSAADVQAESGMTRTQYESARRRLRRALERLFPNRGVS